MSDKPLVESLVWHDDGRVSMSETDYQALRQTGHDLVTVVVAAQRVIQSLSLPDLARLKTAITRVAAAHPKAPRA